VWDQIRIWILSWSIWIQSIIIILQDMKI
jgi:hypothetical protein